MFVRSTVVKVVVQSLKFALERWVTVQLTRAACKISSSACRTDEIHPLLTRWLTSCRADVKPGAEPNRWLMKFTVSSTALPKDGNASPEGNKLASRARGVPGSGDGTSDKGGGLEDRVEYSNSGLEMSVIERLVQY